jgi:hypothetical protein
LLPVVRYSLAWLQVAVILDDKRRGDRVDDRECDVGDKERWGWCVSSSSCDLRFERVGGWWLVLGVGCRWRVGGSFTFQYLTCSWFKY